MTDARISRHAATPCSMFNTLLYGRELRHTYIRMLDSVIRNRQSEIFHALEQLAGPVLLANGLGGDLSYDFPRHSLKNYLPNLSCRTTCSEPFQMDAGET